jgi:hypothetical protein
MMSRIGLSNEDTKTKIPDIILAYNLFKAP